MFQPCPTNAKKSINVSVPRTYSERISSGATSAAPRSAPPAMRLRVLPATQQASRANEEHEDEEGEDADLRERAVQEESPQRLHHAHQQASQERARERAEAAQHDHHEGRDHERAADLRRDVEERHRH